MSVPQGSILTVTLFSAKINSITQCLKPGVDCSLYVDDFHICYRSSNMSIIERQLQLCLNKLQQWATDNGFRFSKTKTLCMHICQKRGLQLDPQHFLDKSPIPVGEETKFLGVMFNRRLSFIPHLKYVKNKALKALNIINVIGNTEWGADRKVMLRLYRSLIRSKLDYGCIVYGSARKSSLQMLDPIHNQGLRLCLGAFRTSPVESLYGDAHEPSLGARCTKLSLQEIKSLPNHPAHNAVFDNIYMKLFDARPSVIPTFGLRMMVFLTASNIEWTFWKHLHILSHHLGVSNHRRLCWIWCICKMIERMHQYTSNFSWKYETGTVITFLFIQTDHGMGILWHVLHSFHLTFHFP